MTSEEIMTEDEARELISKAFGSKQWKPGDIPVRLDPALTPREIDAMKWWRENKPNEPYPT